MTGMGRPSTVVGWLNNSRWASEAGGPRSRHSVAEADALAWYVA